MRRRAAIDVCPIAGLLACACSGAADPVPACGEAPAIAAPAFETVVGSIELLDEWSLFDDTTGPMRQRSLSAQALLVDRPMTDFNTMTVFGGYQVETARSGACRLLEHAPALCDPACVGGVCVAPDTCEPYLVPRSAGPIAIEGAAAPATLAFDELRGYSRLDPEPAPPLAAACSAITARAPGAELGAFTASALVVGALDPDAIGLALELADDRDETITWEPWGTDARVRLRLVSPNRGHGTPAAAIIECDVVDAGTLTVPRDLIARLPPSHAEYCAGYDCPASSLVRYQRGFAETAGGRIELVIGSALAFRIVHHPELAP